MRGITSAVYDIIGDICRVVLHSVGYKATYASADSMYPKNISHGNGTERAGIRRKLSDVHM